LLSPGLKLAQYGFGLPAPGRAALIVSPAEVTTRTSIPAMEIPVAGFDHGVLCLGVERRVGLRKERIGSFARLDIGAMIDELANLDPGSQFRHSAEVITVPMRRDQMIDLLQPGVFDRILDAFRIANRSRAIVARIDQQRFADGETIRVALPPSTSTT